MHTKIKILTPQQAEIYRRQEIRKNRLHQAAKWEHIHQCPTCMAAYKQLMERKALHEQLVKAQAERRKAEEQAREQSVKHSVDCLISRLKGQ